MKRMATLAALLLPISLRAISSGAQAAPSTVTAPSAVTLDECVAAAKAMSPSLLIAGNSLDSAQAALIQVQAKNGVALGLSGEYFHQGTLPGTDASQAVSTQASNAASGAGQNGENLQGALSLAGPSSSLGLIAQHSIEDGGSMDQVSSLRFSGSQTIFDGYAGGRGAALVQEAKAAYRIAQIVYDAAMKSLVYQVRQAYYTLLGDQDTVLLRQATEKQAAENLALYQGLFTAQRATKLDVLEIQVALTQAQLDVRSSQNGVVTDRKKLSLAIGWPLEKQYDVADSPLPELPAIDEPEALKSAFENRSELLALREDISSAGIALSLQKSLGKPIVSITASVGIGQDWTAAVNAGSFTAGASIALPPLFDGGLENAQLRQDVDVVAAYKAQMAQQGLSISIDVGSAIFGITDAKDRNALAAQNLQQAQGLFDFEKAKLTAGTGTTLDVLTAFSALAAARVGLAQAKSNYLLAVLNLNNVMGL